MNMRKILFMMALTAMVLSGCSKEDVKPPMSIKNNDISISHEKTEKLIVENAVEAITYSSENELIAEISDDGIVTGGVKGSTKITVKSGQETAICNVTVETLINYIPEPNMQFGQSRTVIQNAIKSDGEVIVDDESLLQRRHVNGSDFIYIYMFENDKLKISAFAFETTSKTISVIADFLLERYIVVASTGTYEYTFISPDQKTAVGLFPSDDLSTIFVMYMPVEETRSTTRDHYKGIIKNILP